MGIGQILTEIGQGLTSFVPSFFLAIWDAFKSLFLTVTTTGEGASAVETVTGFNMLGGLCLAFVILGICYRIIPIVGSFLNKRIASYKRRKASKNA